MEKKFNNKILKYTIPFIAYFLGIVLLVAAISKLLNFHEFLAIIKSYEILPVNWIPILSILFIGIECLLGILLFINKTQGFAAGLICLLLLGFAILSVYSAITGIKNNCGCFGFFMTNVSSLKHFIQIFVLLFFSILLFIVKG